MAILQKHFETGLSNLIVKPEVEDLLSCE